MKIRVEKVYLNALHKLRTSLPKFIIFLGATFLVWYFGVLLLIPLGKDIFIGDVEASKIVNLILIATLIVLIFSSFREIREVADSLAGIVIYYTSKNGTSINTLRIKKLSSTFRSLVYVLLASFLFLVFKSLLDTIHPALAGMIVIAISIWAIIALYGVVMAVGSEIEEASKFFIKDLEKKLKKRK
jgi:hypothetical protein